MASIPKHLNQIWEKPAEIREPAVNLLKKILGNVVQNPDEPKFQSMNIAKIRKKFSGCTAAFYFLFDAGFAESADGTKLELRFGNREMVKVAYEALIDKIENPDKKLESDIPDKLLSGEPEVIDPAAIAAAKAASSSASAVSAVADESETVTLDPDSVVADAAAADGGAAAVESGGDVSMADASETSPTDPEPTDSEMASAATESADASAMSEDSGAKGALSELSTEDQELFEQLRAHKDTTVTLSMAELTGLSKEEKVALLAKKREEYRKEKASAESKRKVDRERTRRENVKMAMEAQRKREEHQLKMLAERKKREKKQEAERKKRIREKIRREQEARKKERQLAAERKKAAAAGAGSGAAPPP